MLPSSPFRAFRSRGLLAVIAAVLVRCTPEAAPCIALPGASVFVTPDLASPRQHEAIKYEQMKAVALRGRAALWKAYAGLRAARH